VWAGVERDSLSIDQIKDLYNGKTLTLKKPDHFFRSLTNLNIKIQESLLTIKKSDLKIQRGNVYIPPKVQLRKWPNYKLQRLITLGYKILYQYNYIIKYLRHGRRSGSQSA
jgi:hypothetical protein